MEIIKRYIPKGDNNPMKKINPDKIVIHYSGVAGVSAERLALCLYNNNANNVSANYCVDDKKVICTIPPGYMSYGVSGENDHIINIEVCYKDTKGRFELLTIAKLRMLVKRLMRQYNIPSSGVIRHYDLSHTNKKCPMYYVDNPKEWERLHLILTTGKVARE